MHACSSRISSCNFLPPAPESPAQAHVASFPVLRVELSGAEVQAAAAADNGGKLALKDL
jgi:hypothetical protein